MIKTFIRYIKESSSNSKFSLSKDDIEDIFLPFIDGGWFIDIYLGQSRSPKNQEELSDIFIPEVETGYIKPTYSIELKSNSNTKLFPTEIEFTNLITSIIKKIVKWDYDISIIAGDSNASLVVYSSYNINYDHNIRDIINSDNVKYPSITWKNWVTNDSMEFVITIAEKNEVKLDKVDVLTTYDMTGYYVNDDGTPYIEIEKEDLVNTIISYKDPYKKYLLREESDLDTYWESDWVDFDSLIQYYLDKENLNRLIRSFFEYVSYDDFNRLNESLGLINKNKYSNKYDLVNYLSESKNFINILKNIDEFDEIDEFKDILHDIKQEYAIQEMYSRESKYFEEIDIEFDRILDRCFGKNKWSESVIKDTVYYRIDLDVDEILKYVDVVNRDGDNIYNHFIEYYGSDGWCLNPDFDHIYGDVDSNSFNSEVKYIIYGYSQNIRKEDESKKVE